MGSIHEPEAELTGPDELEDDVRRLLAMRRGKRRVGSVHEPEAELVGFEETLEDYARLKPLFGIQGEQEPSLSLRVPLSVMLEAIDQMQAGALRQIARRAERRLATLHAVAEPKTDYTVPERAS